MSQPPLAVSLPLAVYREIALLQRERGREAKEEGVAGQIVAFKEQHKIREALIAEGRQREVA